MNNQKGGEDRMKSWIVIIIALLVGIGGFFGGMYYANSQRAALRNSFGGQFAGQNQLGTRARTNANRPITGEILSQDTNSITVKMQDGSSKIVILSESTTYSKTTPGSKSDLKVGNRVGVFGTTNSDGSVTAQNVQLNPMFRGLNGGSGMRTTQ